VTTNCVVVRHPPCYKNTDVTGNRNYCTNGAGAGTGTSATTRRRATTAAEKKRPAFLARADEDMETAPDTTPTTDQILDAEITAYKADKGQPMFGKDDGFYNPLEWWRIHFCKYPNIWKLASCILAIPATSAPSERVFSAATNIVNKKRVRLKPETLDLLIFLRGNKDFVQWN